MKFRIFCQMAGSAQHGMVYRVYAMGRELVAKGHSVEIVAAHYSHTRNRQPTSVRWSEPEEIDGINYFWLPGIRYSPKSRFGRVISMFAYDALATVWALLVGRRQSCDVVVAAAPSPTVIYPALYSARLAKAKLVFDIRDLWPLTPQLLGGYSKKHPFLRILQRAEDRACRRSDLVTAVAQNAFEHLETRRLSADRFLHLPNGLGKLPEPEPLPEHVATLLDGLAARGAFVVAYTGSIGRANAIASLVKAIPLLPDHIVVVLAGSGEFLSAVHELVDELDIGDRVYFIGDIRHSQVATLLGRADAGFIAAQKTPLYRYGASPTKANEYLAAGLPIVYGVGDPNSAVELSGAGCLFAPEDHEDCARAILELASLTHADRVALGERGKSWLFNHQTWPLLVSTFLAKLDKLCARQDS